MKPIRKYLNTKSQWHPGSLSNYCIIIPFDQLFRKLDTEQNESFVMAPCNSFDIWVLQKEIAKKYIKWAETNDCLFYLYEIPNEYESIDSFKKDYINGKFPNSMTKAQLPKGLHQILPEQL